jgi:hypothetical protein
MSAEFDPDGTMVRRGDRIDRDEAGQLVARRRPENGCIDDLETRAVVLPTGQIWGVNGGYDM